MRRNDVGRLIDFFSKDMPFANAFEYLFEGASDATYILDKRGNFVAINREAEELTGFKREDWIGKSFRKIIATKSLPKAIKGFLNVIRGKSIRFELELKTAFKKTVLVEVASKPLIINGKTVGTLGIARNISERKQVEKALRKSEEKFRNIFESASDAMIFLDRSGRILGVNGKAVQAFGGSKKELLGKHFTKVGIFSLRDMPQLMANFANIIAGKKVAINLTIKNKKGQKIFLECSGSSVKLEDKLAGIMVIARDITKRKQMEKKLQEYSEDLEELVEKRTRQLKEAHEQLLKAERLAAIGEMAAMVGHDLRNPLTGIAGATYYLKTKLGSKMDKKAREMLELVGKSIECSNKIISDLLEYSREIRLELTETTLKPIIKDALTLVKIPKNLRISDLTQNKPKIKVDVPKIERAFINIIKNAIDAMSKGGTLTITSKESNGNLKIAFIDTGAGMPKEVMEKIWIPLFTAKAKGMGLGLPICKRIVEAHGGNISVGSTVSKGTTFTVTIPVKPKLEGGEKIWVNVPESLLSTTTKA